MKDFYNIFHEHAVVRGDIIETKKFYHIDQWDPPLYERLARRYDFHVALVEDLFLELTRAANYICDRVRQFIDPTFRLHEGLILAISGPYMDMTCQLDIIVSNIEVRNVSYALILGLTSSRRIGSIGIFISVKASIQMIQNRKLRIISEESFGKASSFRNQVDTSTQNIKKSTKLA